MQFLRRYGCALLVGLVLAPTPAAAGWSLWPFSDRDELPRQPAPTRQITGLNQQALSNDDPSVFTRLANGPMRLVSSTKNALAFGGNKPMTQVNSSRKTSKQKKKSSSSSWFGWLRPTEQQGPKTVGEWFELDRPGL